MQLLQHLLPFGPLNTKTQNIVSLGGEEYENFPDPAERSATIPELELAGI